MALVIVLGNVGTESIVVLIRDRLREHGSGNRVGDHGDDPTKTKSLYSILHLISPTAEFEINMLSPELSTLLTYLSAGPYVPKNVKRLVAHTFGGLA